MTSYQLFQIEMHGNILPEQDANLFRIDDEFENGFYDIDEEQRKLEHEMELWFSEQSI